MKITIRTVCAIGLAAALAGGVAMKAAISSIFAKSNLVAWCIVPYDAAKRGPEERARMLKRLGITRLAYDWRDKDIPTFDQEIEALQKHGIKLEAFWTPYEEGPEGAGHIRAILDVLKRHGVKTQLWLSLDQDEAFTELSQERKLEVASEVVMKIAGDAKAIGCSVGLYNHGGWYGQPENQIEIIRRLKLDNLGIVYNFHHGHEHVSRFPELLKKMQPYLMAININGMKLGGEKILYVGEGDRELEMLQAVKASGFRGPIGILGHREDVDAEVSLTRNIEGLKQLLKVMGDQDALKSY